MENHTVDNDTSDLCDNTRPVLASDYRNLLIAEGVVAILSIPPNLLLLSVIWRVVLFCPDLRLVLANFSFVLVWYAVGDIVKVVHNLTIPACGYHMLVRTCKVLDSLSTGIAIPNVVFSFLALAIQRLYANLKYKTYDKTHTNGLPFILIICAWTAAVVVQCHDVPMLPTNIRIPVCVSIYIQSSWFPFYANLVAETVATVIAFAIYVYTRLISSHMAINRAQYDLSARFQVDQNLRVNAMLLPSIALQVLCHIPNFFFMAGINGFWNLSVSAKLRLFRITSIWRLIFAMVHPVLGFCLNEHLCKQLLKSRPGILFVWIGTFKKPKLSSVSPIVGVHQTTHFNYLDKLWEKPNRPPPTVRKAKVHAVTEKEQAEQVETGMKP